MRFSRQKYQCGLFPSGDLPNPGIKPKSPAWQVDSLTLSQQGSPRYFPFCYDIFPYIVVIVQSPNCVQLFVTPWTTACQTSLSLTISLSLPRFMSNESVISSNYLILCPPLLLLLLIFPTTGVFSSESTLSIRWPEYWSFSFSIIPSNEYSGMVSFKID